MTKEELNKILEDHKHWLNEDRDGWEKMRADLSGAYLRGTDLRGTDLRGADLSGAYLMGADLRGAYLRGTDLRGADLSEADLSRADLRGADLSRANLMGAYLRGAYLRGADLSEAYLRGTDLRGADLRGAKNIPLIPYSCPDFGIFIGWKKAHGKIVCLEIPEEAKRLSATGRKCRCDKAKVLRIENVDGTPSGLTEVASNHDENFIYKIGEMVSVPDFDEDRWNECSTGIHFFINRQEAVEYYM